MFREKKTGWRVWTEEGRGSMIEGSTRKGKREGGGEEDTERQREVKGQGVGTGLVWGERGVGAKP